LRRAVEREIEIIGEAINRALKEDPDLQIENAKRIVDTRNWVIHGYDKLQNFIYSDQLVPLSCPEIRYN